MRRRTADQAGFSLIELSIAISLVGVLGIAVLTILINSWNAQTNVVSTTQATNRGQLVGQSIERAMRNGIAFDVTEGGTLLRVHTTLSGTKACQAFWVTGGAAYMTSTSGTLPVADTTAWPMPWQSTGATGVGGAQVFSSAGTTLAYAFEIATGGSPVLMKGSISLRPSTMGGTQPCWG